MVKKGITLTFFQTIYTLNYIVIVTLESNSNTNIQKQNMGNSDSTLEALDKCISHIANFGVTVMNMLPNYHYLM